MSKKTPVAPPPLNFRQTIEGMPVVFVPAAAGDMKAIIQFDASGPEPGQYYLTIDSGKCTFHKGNAQNPALTIHTPSDVWLKINSGELSGVDALVKGLYKVDGDIVLLGQLQQLFIRPPDFNIEVEHGRPPGPIPWDGIVWLNILMGCWAWLLLIIDFMPTDFWITYAPPIIVCLLIIVYRFIFNRPMWAEFLSLAFFVVLAVLNAFVEEITFVNWGSTLILATLSLIWLWSMVPPSRMTFTAEYSKYRYIPGVWNNSSFIQPNMAICLCWGWFFTLSVALAFIGKTVITLFLPLLGVRLLLLIPAFIFTAVYQKGIPTRTFKDIDKNINALRVWAWIGIAIVLVVLVLIPVGFKLPY